jgi:hypothetical protein
MNTILDSWLVGWLVSWLVREAWFIINYLFKTTTR